MADYQIGAKFADVFSDLGVLALKPVKAFAKGLLGFVTVVTLHGQKNPVTTAEKIGAKAREWKSKIEASDRSTHLGAKIKVLFGSVRDKFAPARKVLIKEGPLTERQAKLAEATREIDPFIAGFDSENRDIVRVIYYQAKTSRDVDRHGILIEDISGLKIAGWKREYLQKLGVNLSVLLLSREQNESHARKVLTSTPIKVQLLIKDIKDPTLHQQVQFLYYDAQQAAGKAGIEEAVKGLDKALLAIEGMSAEEKKVLSENLGARLRAETPLQAEMTQPEIPGAKATLVRFKEKPEGALNPQKPLSQEVQEAFDAASPFLSDLQKERIIELVHKAREALIQGDGAELKKAVKFLRDHCLKENYGHAERDPVLENLFDTILKDIISLQKSEE